MLRKRYYILFVARDEDGRIRKIPLPLHYAYGFVAAALVGAFTIVGLAGSYTRMLLKTESFNQVRQDRERSRCASRIARCARQRGLLPLRSPPKQAFRGQRPSRSQCRRCPNTL